MKRFTVIFSILLVLCFGGTLAYVAATPDFVPPAATVPAGQNEDPDAPVCDETMDSLLAYLEQKGLISGERLTLASDGLCSLAVSESGAEFYWWDLDALGQGQRRVRRLRKPQDRGQHRPVQQRQLDLPGQQRPVRAADNGLHRRRGRADRCVYGLWAK